MELHNGMVMYLILSISAWEEGGLDIKIVFVESIWMSSFGHVYVSYKFGPSFHINGNSKPVTVNNLKKKIFNTSSFWKLIASKWERK